MSDNGNEARLPTSVWSNRHFRSIAVIMIACSAFYYLPLLAGAVGWNSLHQSLTTLHEFHGLVFFAPVVYAAYVFGISGATLTAFSSILILLPYATSADPYLEGLFRATAFGIILCAVGAAVALIQRGDERQRKNVKELRHLYEVGKAADASETVEEFLSSVADLIAQAMPGASEVRVRIEIGGTVFRKPDSEQQGPESIVTVPLHAKGMSPGLLTVSCSPKYRFRGHELSLLESIADQVAIAIVNAEVHGQTRRRVDQMGLMGETARVIASSFDINEMCQGFAVAVNKLVRFDQASIHLLDETGQNIRVVILSQHRRADLSVGTMHPAQGTGTAWIAHNRKPHIETDITHQHSFASDEFLVADGFKSTIRLPLLAKGRVFGTFNLRSASAGHFGDQDAELLEQPVGQLAVAIENAALLSCVQSHEEQLDKTCEALEAAQGYVAQSETRVKSLMTTVAGLMDDFNGVLSVMTNRAQRAVEGIADSKVRESLQIIEHSAKEAADTVRRLQESATDSMYEDPDRVVVDDMVRQAIDIEKTRKTERGNGNGNGHGIHAPVESLDTRLDYESEFEIKKAVMNILANAMSAPSDMGRLHQHQTQRGTAGETACPTKAVAMLDLKGNLIYVNSSFLKLWGYHSETEVLARPAEHFWQDGDQASVTAQGNTGTTSSWQKDVTGTRKDGSRFDVQVSATTVSEVGNPICLRASFVDISRHKQAEQEIKRSFESLRTALEETVTVLANTVENRYPSIATHQQRVTKLAYAIAKEMGLPDAQVQQIRVAASLHDIGKINMPTEMLEGSSWLSDLETAVLKTHPQVGHDMVRMLPFDGPVAQTILQHHELLDGSGYPSGVSGQEILLGARILAVADTVETIAYRRPQRRALGMDEALAEISRNRGVLYDANVVDACLNLFRWKGFRFEQALAGGATQGHD